MTSKNEVVCKHCTRFEPRHSKTLPGKNEPYRVWQAHAPDDDRDDNGYAEEANGVSETSVHCFNDRPDETDAIDDFGHTLADYFRRKVVVVKTNDQEVVVEPRAERRLDS